MAAAGLPPLATYVRSESITPGSMIRILRRERALQLEELAHEESSGAKLTVAAPGATGCPVASASMASRRDRAARQPIIALRISRVGGK